MPFSVIVVMVVTTAALAVMVVVLVTMVVAVALLVMVVVMSAAALPILVVMVVVPMVMVVVMVVTTATLAVMVVMVMVVVSAVALDGLVQFVIEAGVVDGMEHPVSELVGLDVDDSAHEGEPDLLHGLELAVALHTALDIGEVEGDTVPVGVHDGGLYVSEEATRLPLDPLTDDDHGLDHPGLGIGVPTGDGTLETLGASVGLVEGGPRVVLLGVIVVMVVTAHLIIS